MNRLLFILIMSMIVGCINCPNALNAQTRVAVLPFKNMAGHIKYNPWQQGLADSLRSALLARDTEGRLSLISQDSIDMMVAERNLDPGSSQFESDMWLVAAEMGAEYVITGNFALRSDVVLLNCYIYPLETKMAITQFQAKDIFKKEPTLFESIGIMVRKLYPFFQQ